MTQSLSPIFEVNEMEKTRQTKLTEFGMKIGDKKERVSMLSKLQNMLNPKLSIKSNSEEIVGEEE